MAQKVPQTTVDRLASVVPENLAPGGVPVYVGEEPGGIELYRWGSLVMRLPATDRASAGIENEYRWIERATGDLVRVGIAVPTPRFRGAPTRSFERPWLLVNGTDGAALAEVPITERGRIARDLAVGLAALHAEAPDDAPQRLVLKSQRNAFEEHVRGRPQEERLRELFVRGVVAKPWSAAPIWCHGALVPHGLVTSAGRLKAMTGFGGLHAGDPAIDYAAFHLGFTAQQTSHARVVLRALAAADDDALWLRARAWAAYVVARLLADGDPHGVDALRLLTADT
ncbi:phosphotransferase [Flaviflexus huanghaiensis]|uniref:phosphotransferase n=1 Tax=Flaviflexus huanghaiensis TaxID=1111473 RepID=UPI0015FC6F1C|nr:phosphotransferase [Flaviflexus huanghaiensis]